MTFIDGELKMQTCVINDVPFAILCETEHEGRIFLGIFPAEDLAALCDEDAGPVSQGLVWAERGTGAEAGYLLPVERETIGSLDFMLIERSAQEVLAFRRLLAAR